MGMGEPLMNLDNVLAGVVFAPPGTDNIIFTDGTIDGFEHPECFDIDETVVGNHVDIANNLPTTHPVGDAE